MVRTVLRANRFFIAQMLRCWEWALLWQLHGSKRQEWQNWETHDFTCSWKLKPEAEESRKLTLHTFTSKAIKKTNALTPKQKKNLPRFYSEHITVAEMEYVVKTVQIILHNAFLSQLKKRNFKRVRGLFEILIRYTPSIIINTGLKELRSKEHLSFGTL